LGEPQLKVRGVDFGVIQRVREYLVTTYGTYYRYQGRFITAALEVHLEQVARSNMQHRPAMTVQGVRPGVRDNLVRLRVELLNRLGDGSTGQIPDFDLKQAIRDLGFRDLRTVKAYLKRLMELGYARPINSHVWQISKAWVPEFAGQQEATMEDAPHV
jgi:hypothetical protein